MHRQHFVGLTTEQAENSFSNDELSMLTFGNTKEANAYRELLAYRRQQVLSEQKDEEVMVTV